jgi:hypothetical protein
VQSLATEWINTRARTARAHDTPLQSYPDAMRDGGPFIESKGNYALFLRFCDML